jgi:short-chain fatty acids transporter
MYFFAKKSRLKVPERVFDNKMEQKKNNLIGFEKLDHSKLTGMLLGLLVLLFCCYLAITHTATKSLQFINPNYLNLFLLGLALFFHKSFYNFIKAIDNAIGGTAAILIQFPLYFGIMGIVTDMGIVSDFATYFQNISTPYTYPLYTFLSAGLVNFLVPSGGGQWYIQGPLIIQSTVEMGISLEKSIMAMAYGDQLTNLMQPFWALPLLGITGLKAKEILPYTLIMMVIGFLVFSAALLIF